MDGDEDGGLWSDSRTASLAKPKSSTEQSPSFELGHTASRHEWDNPKHPHFYGFVMTDEKKSELFVSCLQFHVLVEKWCTKVVKTTELGSWRDYRETSNANGHSLTKTNSMFSTSSTVMFDYSMANAERETSAVHYRKRSIMVGAMEYVFADSRSNRVTTVKRHHQPQYTTIRQKIATYQPIALMLVSRTPLFQTCKRLLSQMYTTYIAPKRCRNACRIDLCNDSLEESSRDRHEFFTALQSLCLQSFADL